MSAKSWKKVLYEVQEYPDNYTDTSTFLIELKKNVAFQEVDVKDAVFGAILLIQELCTVVAFILLYIYLYNEWVQPELVFTVSGVLTAVGFLVYGILHSDTFRQKAGHYVRTVLIFIVFGHLFSPILHTLTDTISTDTIYTMTFFMLLVRLVFFDYGVNCAVVSKALSLNASVFAAVCLASRLASSYHAFILITFGVECFVLFPFLRSELKLLPVTLVLIITDVYFLMLISNIFTVLFILILLFINPVCPLLFVKYQRYKENIYGPWDEAVVEDTDNVIS